MTKFPIALALLFVIGAAVFAVLLAKRRGAESGTRPLPAFKARKFMTDREEAMYHRLRQSLPEHHAFAQVSFSALLTGRGSARNYFDRKVADFVICDRALRPVAVIELDDASHHDKGSADAARDAMLKNAGYKVLRYPNVPDIADLRRDIPTP